MHIGPDLRGATSTTAAPWVSVEGVAERLGVAKDSVYRWLESRGRHPRPPRHRLEFGSWLSPELKLYVLKELQRLKDDFEGATLPLLHPLPAT